MTSDRGAEMIGRLCARRGGGGFELRETHISWVLLDATRALKIKKPVSLGFLDFSTKDLRKRACDAEVALNRRLAADVYLGVRPVTREADGGIAIGGAGEVIDWAVEMRRLPDESRADLRLGAGRLGAGDIERLAVTIAEFHRAARADEVTAAFGSSAAIRGNVEENFDQTRDEIDRFISRAQATEIERWQLDFLRDQAELFVARRRAGYVRDGHGDLRLEHVYLDEHHDTVRIIDCIEFNDRFRFGDVCSDVAFLAMDLTRHDRPDLAERFLAAYARASNDYDLYPLVDFYESYRAFVRGKVSAMMASARGASLETRLLHEQEARRYFMLALAESRRPLYPPRLFAVGGVIAAGKSTIADAIAADLACPVVDSDRTRKHMLGVRPTERVYDGPWSNAYGADFTERVYDEVLRRASVVLGSGRSVIIDASFRTRTMREAARTLARQARVPFTFVECRAPEDVCRARLERRARGESVSDGRLEIFDAFLARYEPVNELPSAEHLVIDTTEPLDRIRHCWSEWGAALRTTTADDREARCNPGGATA